MNTQTNDITEVFGQPIHTYTRAQAIEDGEQVDASSMAREAGFVFPVYLTRAVYEHFVAVPDGVECQDEAGRMWDILTMTRFAVRGASRHRNRLPIALYVRNSNTTAPKLVRLVAGCGPTDIDNPAPAITIMMPDED